MVLSLTHVFDNLQDEVASVSSRSQGPESEAGDPQDQSEDTPQPSGMPSFYKSYTYGKNIFLQWQGPSYPVAWLPMVICFLYWLRNFQNGRLY